MSISRPLTRWYYILCFLSQRTWCFAFVGENPTLSDISILIASNKNPFTFFFVAIQIHIISFFSILLYPRFSIRVSRRERTLVTKTFKFGGASFTLLSFHHQNFFLLLLPHLQGENQYQTPSSSCPQVNTASFSVSSINN